MPASGPRSRGAKVHPRSCQGCQPWPRASASSGLVLANQNLDGITGRGTSAPPSNTCRLLARDHAAPESTLALAKAASLGRERVRPLAWCSRPRSSAALLEGASAPSSNTCRLLARDHAAPESTLALAKAASLGCARVRPLAWCSRPRNSAASLEGARMYVLIAG